MSPFGDQGEIKMDYIVVGDTAHVAGFDGTFDLLVNYFPAALINTLEVLGVKKIVWGREGENWELLADFPRLDFGSV